MVTRNTAVGVGDLMSSIAAMREMLLHQPSSQKPDELSILQQSRYEERLKLEDERRNHQEIVDDLNRRLKEAKEEARQEKSIRLSLEETSDALEKHNEELSAQIESLSKAPPSSSEPAETESSEKIKQLEKEKEALAMVVSKREKELDEANKTSDAWQSKFATAQRQVKELQIQVDCFRKDLDASRHRQKEIQEDKNTKYESFQKRLEESIAARKKAEEELQTMKNMPVPITKEAEHGNSQAQGASDELEALQGKCDRLKAEKAKAEEQITLLKTEIEVLRSRKTTAEVEEEQHAMAKVDDKIVELSGLYEKMKKEAEELAASSASTEKLAMAKTKVGAILESRESQLRDKLAMAQAKLKECSDDLKRVREDFRKAKDVAAKVQAELSECQKQQNELSGGPAAIGEEKADSGAVGGKATGTTTTKKAVVKKKSKGAQKKRAAGEDEGNAAKKKKT